MRCLVEIGRAGTSAIVGVLRSKVRGSTSTVRARGQAPLEAGRPVEKVSATVLSTGGMREQMRANGHAPRFQMYGQRNASLHVPWPHHSYAVVDNQCRSGVPQDPWRILVALRSARDVIVQQASLNKARMRRGACSGGYPTHRVPANEE